MDDQVEENGSDDTALTKKNKRLKTAERRLNLSIDFRRDTCAIVCHSILQVIRRLILCTQTDCQHSFHIATELY